MQSIGKCVCVCVLMNICHVWDVQLLAILLCWRNSPTEYGLGGGSALPLAVEAEGNVFLLPSLWQMVHWLACDLCSAS